MDKIIIVIFAIIIICVFIIDKVKTNNIIADNEKFDIKDNKLPYKRKYLLTKNELWLYKSLKEITDKYGYTILAKVRLADLVEVSNEVEKKDYLKYFSKIKSKHIDFAICNSENLYPLLLIELNDNSHKNENRVERDNFITKILNKSGYKILFVYGTQKLEEQINNALNVDVKGKE